MSQSLVSMLGDRELVTEDEEHFMLMVGQLSIGDIFALLTS